MPLLIKLRQAVLRLSRLGIRTSVNGSLIRFPDIGKGQIGWKVPIWKASRDIYDSLWISECPLRECHLGIDLGGH